MLIKKNYFLIVQFVATMILTSCGGNKKEGNGDEISDSDSTKTEVIDSQITETFFQVPSPGEMLAFIKKAGGSQNKNVSFLNNVDNQKKYTDAKSKALNFGIYSCDLSYCSIFQIGSESLKYFKTVKELGDQIGVSTAIKPELMKRLESNLKNPDSLSLITDDVYFSSFQTLEESKQGPTLCLVVTGGWIESLYIATNLSKYDEKNPVIARLADQKYTLDNLIEFMKKHGSDTSVSPVLAQLTELQAEFNKIDEKEVVTVSSIDKSKKVLGGSSKELVLSAERHKVIVEKITSIRNSFTLAK